MEMTLENATLRGLSGFRLKDVALVCMVLDHVHYFFEADTPLFFSWIGRLAAPLFLFCLIEGFTHTLDKRRYVLTIYLLSAAMGLVRFSFYNVLRPLVRSDGFFPENAMLSSFAVLLFVLWGLSMISEKKYARGVCFVVVPVAIPFLFVLLFSLCAGVGAHLRRERREKTAVYESGGVRFYPLRRQAYADDVLLPLTKSEYDIALFLARYHGQVFDRERIYENVFGYEKDGNDTVIAEHIKNIRRKLAQVDRDPIETVWGVGYRWRG